MLDPHFSSSLTQKPRRPQSPLKTIPLRSFLPVSHLLIQPPYCPASQTWITSKLPQLSHHSLTSPQHHKRHRTYPSSFQPSPVPCAPVLKLTPSPPPPPHSRPGHPSGARGGGGRRGGTRPRPPAPGRGRGRRARPGSSPCLTPVEDPLHLSEVLGRDVLLQARLHRLQGSRHGAARNGTRRGARGGTVGHALTVRRPRAPANFAPPPSPPGHAPFSSEGFWRARLSSGTAEGPRSFSAVAREPRQQ